MLADGWWAVEASGQRVWWCGWVGALTVREHQQDALEELRVEDAGGADVDERALHSCGRQHVDSVGHHESPKDEKIGEQRGEARLDHNGTTVKVGNTSGRGRGRGVGRLSRGRLAPPSEEARRQTPCRSPLRRSGSLRVAGTLHVRLDLGCG